MTKRKPDPVDRKTYYTEKYGPDYFRTIGRKGGENGTAADKRRAGIIGGEHRRRADDHDPGVYSRMGQKSARRRGQMPKREARVTCICGAKYQFTPGTPGSLKCFCGYEVWYIPSL